MASGLLVILLALTSVQALSPNDKQSRTPAQRKMASALLDQIRDAKEHPPDVKGALKNGLIDIDEHQRALVDVRAPVTPEITREIVALGGVVSSTSVEWDSIIAWVPLLKLEQLADNPLVRSIQPADKATIKKHQER